MENKKYRITIRVQKTISLSKNEIEEIYNESPSDNLRFALENYTKALLVEDIENNPNLGSVKIENLE